MAQAQGRYGLVWAAVALAWPVLGAAWDDTRAIVAAAPQCLPGARCSIDVSRGLMAGQVYLNFKGEAPAAAARTVRVRVFAAGSSQPVVDRTNFTSATGAMSSLIADGQVLAPGRYRFEIEGFASGSFQVTSAQAATPPPDRAAASPAPASLVGIWHGINGTLGAIELRADGSYLYNGSRGGTWRAQGTQVLFTGALASWNGGRAKLGDGFLEFYWKNAEGFNQWMVYAR